MTSRIVSLLTHTAGPYSFFICYRLQILVKFITSLTAGSYTLGICPLGIFCKCFDLENPCVVILLHLLYGYCGLYVRLVSENFRFFVDFRLLQSKFVVVYASINNCFYLLFTLRGKLSLILGQNFLP